MNSTNPRLNYLWRGTLLKWRLFTTGNATNIIENNEVEEKRGIGRPSRYHLDTSVTHLPNTLIGLEKQFVRIALVRIEYKLVILCLLIHITKEEI